MTGVGGSFMLNYDLAKGFVHKLINHHLTTIWTHSVLISTTKWIFILFLLIFPIYLFISFILETISFQVLR